MNHKLGLLLLAGAGAGLLTLASGQQKATPVIAAGAVDGCPETSTPASQTGTTLQNFADDTNGGVVFEGGASELQLAKAGGLFEAASLAIVDRFNTAAAADYDNDGWTDLVVGASNDKFIRFFKNETGDNPAPDWSDPTDIRTPKFTRTVDIEPAGAAGGHAGMTSGDFNQDGNADFFYYVNSGGDDTTIDVQRIYLGNGDGTFQSPYNASSSFADFGYYGWSSKNSAVFDWNRDGWPDIVFGTKAGAASNTGAVRVFLNSCTDVWSSPTTACSVDPDFIRTDVLTNVDLGNRGVNALTMADYTGDGVADMVVGAPSECAPLRLYTGLSGGGIDTSSYESIGNSPYSEGAATVILSADFNLNGGQDVIFGTDNFNCGSNRGGEAYLHTNDLTPTPFSSGPDQRLSQHGDIIGGVAVNDYDLGVVLDYDQDPDSTPDFLIADGNHSGSFYLFANRVVSQFISCGEVESGILDLGVLATEEMVVTSARLNPTVTMPPGTTVTFYMSNEEPANWQLASPCVDDATEYCVSFPKPVGRDVRWKAEMCSNAAHTATPTISGMEVTYDYTQAEEHYRAGVVVDDGVAYVGAFRQPGSSGHFYALSGGLGQTYWDLADSLNSVPDGTRHMYTSDTAGTSRLDFSTANAGSAALQATLGVAGSTQASNVIAWQRGFRFGVGETSRLGSVENSTPAVVRPPSLPIWYPRADEDTRQLMDTFIAEHTDRPTIVLVGSKDGALHAVRSKPTDITDTAQNGVEAWAYVPAKVANDLTADMIAGTATSYPDGSPTVADVILDDGEIHTIAIVSGGNGHKSVFALDVTETIDEDTDAILGPQPLWHVVPGGSLAGQALSKPVVARVSIGGTSRFLAIMATGSASDNPIAPFTKGRDVLAVDMTTGATVWKFQSKCPVTSDIVIAETDDDLEDGDPEFDGYIDRAMFADSCGYIYKVDPAQNVGNTYITGIGSIPTGELDPEANAITAIFSTTDTACGIGAERPIVGTIGARTDATKRLVLYFGTGGVESFDPSLSNAFYAVYADSGEIRGCADAAPERGRIEGICTTPAGPCEKFYGGVVVSESDVIVTRAIDAPIGTGLCEFGSSEITGFSTSEFDTSFSVGTSSATVSSLYGAGGAIYFATLSGDIVKIGDARAENAGDDSANGGAPAQADESDDGAGGEGMEIEGWRVVE